MIKTVVIDFDDTLCLTEAACFDLENAALARMDRPLMPRDIHIRTWGKPLFEAILERSPGIDIGAFKSAYRPLIQEFTDSGRVDAIPRANFDTLDELIKEGKTIMMLTSRSDSELTHLLAPDHLLTSRVTTVYHKDNTRHHKPDPRAFAELLGDNQLEPAECVYVGDSIGDGIASKGAGMYFIASLESGLRLKDDFRGVAVDVFIERFTDLAPAVASLERA